MKIVLISPPNPFLYNSKSHPPFGLLYIASMMDGHDVELVDLCGDEEYLDTASHIEADLVGITCATPNYGYVKEICKVIDSPIIVGGPHPTFLPHTTMEELGCSIATNECELIIKDILRDAKAGTLSPMYRGSLIPPQEIPSPRVDLIDIADYNPTWSTGRRSAVVFTGRGCPYRCKFCSLLTGRKYREIPIDIVMSEVERAIRLGANHIRFGDDNMGVSNSRLVEILEAMREYRIPFRIGQHVRSLDMDVLKLARDCGCEEICYGIESGSQKILDLMYKDATVEDNLNAIRMTRAAGMKSKAFLIVNFPGETEDTVRETIDYMRACLPDSYLISTFTPLPGSDVYDNPHEYGVNWITEDWSSFYLFRRDGRPCFTTDYLTIDRQLTLHNELFNALEDMYHEQCRVQ